MLPEVLREHLRAVPYVPFTVCTGDGRTYRVPHPDFAALSPGGRSLYLWLDEARHAVLEVFLITALEHEPLPEPPK